LDDRNLYDAIYGGGPGSAQLSTDTNRSNYGSWSPDSWEHTSVLPIGNDFMNAQSVLSLSEESLSSGGEEVSVTEAGQRPDPAHYDYKDPFMSGNAMPDDGYGYLYDGSDGNFNV